MLYLNKQIIITRLDLALYSGCWLLIWFIKFVHPVFFFWFSSLPHLHRHLPSPLTVKNLLAIALQFIIESWTGKAVTLSQPRSFFLWVCLTVRNLHNFQYYFITLLTVCARWNIFCRIFPGQNYHNPCSKSIDHYVRWKSESNLLKWVWLLIMTTFTVWLSLQKLCN